MISRIWTIGHSTRKIDIFLSLLQENGIKLVADVRMYPGSRRYPQFGREALANSLREAGIEYEHFPELGGRRKLTPIQKIPRGETRCFGAKPITRKRKNFRSGTR